MNERPNKDWVHTLITFAFGLLATLIISAVGQWIVWIQWSSRLDEKISNHAISILELRQRPLAADRASVRISILEVRLRAAERMIDGLKEKRSSLDIPAIKSKQE